MLKSPKSEEFPVVDIVMYSILPLLLLIPANTPLPEPLVPAAPALFDDA